MKITILTFLIMCSLFADTVKLKSGEEYSGEVVGVYVAEGKATLRMYLKNEKKDIVLSDIEMVLMIIKTICIYLKIEKILVKNTTLTRMI